MSPRPSADTTFLRIDTAPGQVVWAAFRDLDHLTRFVIPRFSRLDVDKSGWVWSVTTNANNEETA